MKITTALIAFTSLFVVSSLTACVDPYYSGPSGGYNSPNYGGYGGGYNNGYDERRERRELERERDRLEDERRRLEEERRRNEPVYRPPPPPPPPRPQERCPSGFSPSENKCSKEERRRGCQDMRLPGGLGCVKR